MTFTVFFPRRILGRDPLRIAVGDHWDAIRLDRYGDCWRWPVWSMNGWKFMCGLKPHFARPGKS
jgi:hypothetical protein